MLGQWRQALGASWSQSSYAPVGQSEGEKQSKSTLASLREFVVSKTFWRLALLFATVLLILNLLTPAKETLAHYGITKASSQGSEILDKPIPEGSVDWSQFAYCQYVTNENYLCNSVMIFESLQRAGAKADKLMMYPSDWTVDTSTSAGRLLVKARDEYKVALVPVEVQHFAGDSTWADSFTKLLAFNQTQYKRVLSLDSDATVLKSMDELFTLPSAPVAMPRAYWLDEFYLSSQLVLVEPSEFHFSRIQEAFNNRKMNDYDMEIVNDLFGDSCFIIPHRKYDLLTGEFKGKDHHKYLGSKEEKWDPDVVYGEAKFLHFSDWPLPKPWLDAPAGMTEKEQPACHETEDGKQDCRDREYWLGFYTEFKDRRKRVCGSDGTQNRRRDLLDVPLTPSKFEPIF